MKKIVCLMLAFLMIVSIASCGNPGNSDPDTEAPTTEELTTEEVTTEEPTTEEQTTEEPTTEMPTTDEPEEEEPEEEEPPVAPAVFKTGYAREVITPSVSATSPKSGFTQVADDLYTTCLAVNDGEKTALFISLDMKSLMKNHNDAVKDKITRTTGVPADNIFISVTHTHSVIEYGSYPQWGASTVATKTANAAKKAIQDLSDSKILIGTGDTTGTAFVRRYLMPDGTMTSIAPGRGAVGTAYDVSDTTLQVVRFAREDKKDIVLTNWQGHLAHAVSTLGMTDAISADITHYLRTDIEAGDDDTQVIFFAGASGNLNLNAPNDEAKVYDGYIAVAHAIAAEALEVMEDLEEIESGKINIKNRVYTAQYKEDSPEAIADAWEQLSTRKDEMSGAEENKYRYLLARNGIKPDTGTPSQNFTGTDDLNISAISIGELAFVTAPYEMFDNNGVQIKEGSSFKMTVVLTNAGGSLAYMPSIEAWNTYGGYETEATYFEPGTAELLVAQYLEMLEELEELA